MGDQVTQKTVLNSGLRVLTGKVSDQATNFYNIQITVESGFSDDEIDGQAHFLEHMLFNGIHTSDGFLDYKTLRENREKEGVFFGAYTTPIKTCYTASVPINLGQAGLDKALEELSCMLINPALPEDRIAHEKKVICNEWGERQGSLPIYLYEQAFMNGFRSNPAFGHRGLGEKPDIKQTTRQDLLNFMADHYTQPNTSIVVTGPVDHDEVLKSVTQSFSEMPLHTRTDYPEETPLEGSHSVKELDFIPHNFFCVVLPWPGYADYKTSLETDVAASVISHCLNNNIREDTGDTYGLDTGAVRFREEGFFIIQTSTEPETASRIIKNIAFELRQITNGDISDALQTIKKSKGDHIKSLLTNSTSLAYALSEDESSFQRLYDVDKEMDRLDNVSVKNIQDVVRGALSGAVTFAGLGAKETFMPHSELKKIFSLPEQAIDIRLKDRFKPNI